MKRKVLLRIIGIGIFHMVLYLYVVPFVIYPKFGKNGFEFTIAVAIIISIAVLGTIFLEKKIKGDKNE
ncbi:MAG: hypothetical protein K8S13_20720 [Desulfobacula sp.]|uniref:hypothetical protein n=1 Tax=Desulfobacula sp. TaxID=2593537 RepID=UPI0025BBE3E3|nr:hypothetical protein [Desulfobacula sp.]MCD4722258.1 hypothetical protein [Desulfobacula sp.]